MRPLLIVIASLFTFTAAAEGSLAGFWKTIDDKTGKPKGLIEFVETDGVFRGILRETYKEPRKEICEVCPGDKKGKPFIGMEIVWDVKSTDKEEWGGGRIMDPENGKTYRVTLKLAEEGKKLRVRGHIAMFFRTQYWERSEAPAPVKEAAPVADAIKEAAPVKAPAPTKSHAPRKGH